MADKKISALTGASTPLAGTEVLPIVQGGATVKVAVSDLTAGRAVSASSLSAESASIASSSTNSTTIGLNNTAAGGRNYIIYSSGGGPAAAGTWGIYDGTAGQNRFSMDSSGNVTVGVGNFVPGTAAKGINFTANTPAAGMTSQLLNWYEEGTFTPNQGADLTLVGAFSSTGKYTRIGRSVTISGTVTGATSIAVTAAGVITSNLPFTAGTAGHGSATNAANTAFASVICTTTNVTSAGAIAATATITFSATYFV